jgi:hypothetical protein
VPQIDGSESNGVLPRKYRDTGKQLEEIPDSKRGILICGRDCFMS